MQPSIAIQRNSLRVKVAGTPAIVKHLDALLLIDSLIKRVKKCRTSHQKLIQNYLKVDISDTITTDARLWYFFLFKKLKTNLLFDDGIH